MEHEPDKLQTLAATDASVFARLALKHHLRHKFAGFHRLLFEWHGAMIRSPLAERTGLRFALASPRGSAKSTVVSLILPLHDIAYQRERYILLVSATQRQAIQRLRAIRGELIGGSPLLELYPLLRNAIHEHSTKHLVVGGTRIEALGAGQELRGISYNSWRPTKIILDDAESSASAESPRRRQKLVDWFREVIEHLGDKYTHLFAIGTILHPAGLLASLLARPDFMARKFRSIEAFAPTSPLWEAWRRVLTDAGDRERRGNARKLFLENREAMEKGTSILWKSREDYEQLMVQLVTQGRRAFYQEKQNEPMGPEDALFAPEQAWRARRVTHGWEVCPPQRDGAPMVAARGYRMEQLRLFAYLDAALGKGRATGEGDFAALAVAALAPDSTILLVSLWVRRAPPSQQVAVLFDTHSATPLERLAVEGTGFQELLLMPIEEERARRRASGQAHDVSIDIVKPTRKKESRIAALEPLIESGRLSLAEELPEEFWTELSRFPRVSHDDALDAAAGAVELAMRQGEGAGVVRETRRAKPGAVKRF